MLLSEIINNNEAYHTLDLLVSRFAIYHDSLQKTLIKLKDYKNICIQQQMYVQWIDTLIDLDDNIREFIEMSQVIIKLIKYFSFNNINYVSQQQILSMVEEIISLRKVI